MDEAQIENTLANALDNLDYDAVEAAGSHLFEGFEPMDTLWSQHGVGVIVTVSQGQVGVSVQVEGESDLVWKGTKEQILADPDSVAKKAMPAILQGLPA